MSEFVFCADLHLDDSAWVDRPIQGDAYDAFRQIVSYCLQQRTPLILGGDVFDKRRPPARAVWHFCRQLDYMAAAQLPVYVISGQHELSREQPWFTVHPWAKSLHAQSIVLGVANVYGLDWLPAGQLQVALDNVPMDTDILVCHQVWEDFMGSICRSEGKFADISHAKIVLTGDYHKQAVLQVPGKQGQPMTVFSPGSTCMQDISEPVDKWFYHFTTTPPLPLEWRRVPIVSRGCERIEICGQEGLDRLCATLMTTASTPDSQQRPLLRVTYPADLPEAHQRLVAAAAGKVHLFEDLQQTGQETVVDFAAAPAGAFDDLCAAVTQLRPAAGDTAAAIALRLLRSPQPSAEVQAVFTEFLAAFGKPCSTT